MKKLLNKFVNLTQVHRTIIALGILNYWLPPVRSHVRKVAETEDQECGCPNRARKIMAAVGEELNDV